MAITQLHTACIKDGTIVNADIDSSAAIALGKLGTSGTAGSGNFLRGDGAWTAIDLTALNASNLTSGTVAAARLDTATTQSAGNNSTKIATTAFVSTAVTNLIGGAPGALDTLNELAAAINDDSSYASTITTALGTKLPLAGGTLTGALTATGGISVTGGSLDINEKIKHLGDLDTFIGFPGTDTFGVSTSNIERLRVNSAGRLKINHNQTSGQLDETWLSIFDANSGTNNAANDQAGVSKNYSMINLHNYGSGSPGDTAGIGFGAGSSFAYTKGSIGFERTDGYGRGALVFCTNNDADTTLVNNTDERLRITQDGKIGIGTTSPTYQLHVGGEGIAVDRNAGDPYISLRTSGSTKAAIYGGTSTGLRFWTLPSGGSLEERLRITPDGRLWLGITSWAGHASSDDLIIGDGSGPRGLTIYSGTTSEGGIFFADGTSSNASYRGIVAYEHNNDAMAFRTAALERLRIDSDGDVNIKGGIINLGEANTSSGHINSYEVLTFNIDTDNDDTNRYFGFYKDGATSTGTCLLKIQEDEKVGFGLSSPQTSLHVSQVDAGLWLGNPLGDSHSSGQVPTLKLYSDCSEKKAYIDVMWGGDNAFDRNITFGGSNLILHSPGGNNGTEALKIEGDRVQVGRDNPGTLLTTDLSIRGRYVNADGDFSRLYFRNSSDSGSCTASIRGRRNQLSNYSTSLVFHTNHSGTVQNSGEGEPRMQICEDGVTLQRVPVFASKITYDGSTTQAKGIQALGGVYINEYNGMSDNNDRFVAPYDGFYFLTFYTNIWKSSSGSVVIKWYKNGSAYSDGTHGTAVYQTHAGGGGWEHMSSQIIIALDENDYVQIYRDTANIRLDGGTYGHIGGFLISAKTSAFH